MIAVTARGDHVRPIFWAILTRRYDVIKRELFWRKLTCTILAGVIVAEINILAREFQSGCASRSHVPFEPDDAWQAMGLLLAASALGVVLKNVDLSLKPKYERLLPTHELDRLIARIQNQGAKRFAEEDYLPTIASVRMIRTRATMSVCERSFSRSSHPDHSQYRTHFSSWPCDVRFSRSSL